MTKAVVAKNVTKKFKLYAGQTDRLKDLVLPGNFGKEFYALRNVSFEAKQGDIIGLVGVNGSGKSTLSNIIAGIVPQTSGSIEINGETAIIDVSAGLNNKLTGRENIKLKCLMLGFTNKEIKKMEPEIIEFAELETFIDQPVKSYSKGMKSRLGFSINISINPDILIVDEALSVGDKAFAKKSLDKMKEFRDSGKTMFFVSHSSSQIKEFCNKALWLEFGETKAYGDMEDVMKEYDAFLKKYNKWSKKKRAAFREEGFKRQSLPEKELVTMS
ncbi:teichoic acids export ABC transporter ATP-binding subunit TagH [Alteribacillus iranensis]|uniref:Teichoic acid transport system ATP-binding protein n=1 Tax=Alteribacillus iranensis TaxID=930128 RepID=A0A1I2D4F6_9BACI|nr:teichoic acids export ABC transporter ATP-binding subunit TagH [Alteribacillus iranensis]SFE74943.1 teichoic acid transport system ATP-binding protein [Alteribacillus iranensis]